MTGENPDQPGDREYYAPSLRRFAEAAAEADSLKFAGINPGDTVTLMTRSGTKYTLVARDPAKRQFDVQGGKHFPQPTRCTITGSTSGGSMLQMNVFLKGFRVEIFPGKGYRPPPESTYTQGDSITTSPIEQIWIERGSPTSGLGGRVRKIVEGLRQRLGRK